MRLKEKWLVLLILLFGALVLLSVLFRFFGHDEFEHVHSAWYLANGYLPYLDFFQVHHPLLWLVLAPLIIVLGESLTTVFILRLLMALLTLGSVHVVYRIGRLVVRSKEAALLSALFLLSTVAFVEKGIQIRPDVPQVFFALLSIYYLLLFFNRSPKTIDMREPESSRFAITHPVPPAAVHPSQEGNQQSPPGRGARRVGWVKNQSKERSKSGSPIFICLSALFAAISFLFLQKTLFLLFAYGLIFVFKLFKRELSVKSVAYFVLSFALPLAGLVVYLLASGTFSEYLLTNWLVPARLLAHFSPHHTLLGMWAENSLLWLLLFFAVGTLLLRKRANPQLRLVTFMAVLLLVCACLMRLPFKQNFMLPLALLCIPAAIFFKVLCFRFRWSEKRKMRAVLIIIFVPFVILTGMIFISNRAQLEKIGYVLQNSNKSDVIYDGDIRFNLFRKDIHYFWYGLKKNKEFATYRKLTGRYPDYDIYRLIREKKPKFISLTRLKIEQRGLDTLYKETPFAGLYIKKVE